jgi:hypothetical protein
VVEKVEHIEQPTWIPAIVQTFLLYLLYRYSTRGRWYLVQNRRGSIYSIDFWVPQARLLRLAHLALAAFRAISRRLRSESALALAGPPALPPFRAMADSSSGVRFLARARPPLRPPSLPRATA